MSGCSEGRRSMSVSAVEETACNDVIDQTATTLVHNMSKYECRFRVSRDILVRLTTLLT